MSDVRDRVLEFSAPPATRLFGTDVPRKEDDRLLQGDGQFTDDVDRAHIVEMAVGRCPYPHARIVRVDADAARALSGVRHVLVGSDVAALTGPIGILRPIPEAPAIPQFALAERVATYEGQPVVSVAATSRHIAEDALDLIEIEYEPLPHVTDVISAMEPGAPVIQPDVLSSNLLVSNPQGSGDAAAKFLESDVVVEGAFLRQSGHGPADGDTSRAGRMAARRSRARRPCLDAGSASLAPSAGRDARTGRGRHPGRHVGRRRRLRDEARRLPRGRAGLPARHGDPPAREVGRGSQRALPCLVPRPGVGARLPHRGARRRPHPRDVRRLRERPRRCQQLLRRLAALDDRLQRSLQGGRRLRRAPCRRHEQDADRRLSRLRPTGSQFRLRATHGQAGPHARNGPGRASGDEHVEARRTAVDQPDRRRSTTAGTTSAACEWPPKPSTTTVIAAKAAARAPTAAYHGIGFASYVERTGYASSKFLAAPRIAVRGARERDASGQPERRHRRLHRRRHHRSGFRDDPRPDGRRILRDPLRRHQRARRGHGGLPAQHRLVRLADGHRRRRRAARSLLPVCASERCS